MTRNVHTAAPEMASQWAESACITGEGDAAAGIARGAAAVETFFFVEAFVPCLTKFLFLFCPSLIGDLLKHGSGIFLRKERAFEIGNMKRKWKTLERESESNRRKNESFFFFFFRHGRAIALSSVFLSLSLPSLF